MTAIGDSAFYNCEDLETIVLPNSVNSIGNGAFSCCESLNSITLPDSLRCIGKDAFYKCMSLTNITLPNSVRYVGGNCFQNCDELTLLIVPDEPFEVGNDTTLGLADSYKLSIVRAHHSLCPDYMLHYIPKYCPFMIEGNPRRYYAGAITKDSVVIVPAIGNFTLQQAIDSIDGIFDKHFSLPNPCSSYYPTQEMISRFVTVLGLPMFEDVLHHYYNKFYEAGSNNELDVATINAFKHVMLGGREDEDFMWDIIITKYGSANEINNTRFLMNKFNDISAARDSVYQHTIDSLKTVYYDVLYPSSLREMCGYWVSVNDTTQEGNLTDAPEYIINVADLTCPNGTTILSAPKCNWASKKKKDHWQNKTYDNLKLRYSCETGYNQETQTVQLIFSDQSKKIANTKLQHQALDMTQNLEATLSATLESFQKELNRGLANNRINFGTWGAYTGAGFAIGLGAQLAIAAVVFAIMYASNIESAQRYEILLTQQAPKVLDATIRYAFARYNYNNGHIKQTEDIKKLTFVKWEESDSIVFISDKGKPIFIGEEVPADSPLLIEYNANKSSAAHHKINENNIGKLRQKAEELLLLKERKETTDSNQSNEEESKEVLFF